MDTVNMMVNTIKKLDKLYDKFNELMITEYKEKPSVNVTLTKDEAETIMGALMTSQVMINLTDDGK